MFEVSNEYKLAVADSHRISRIRGVITAGNTVIELDDNDIIKDTVYITNQCTNGNEYEYGSVYAGECGLTIKNAIDRYSLYDAELRLYWSLYTGSQWEEIPLGVYYISEPNRINDKISIKALDGMTKLNISVSEDTAGRTSQLVRYIADKCGVDVAQTDEELDALPNGAYLFSIKADLIDTYRDALAYICMLNACFATFDRYGKLKLVQYAKEPCAELGKKQRFMNASFSDYVTKFIGIKARFIADENYAPYEEGGTGKGLILDMGDIPILRGLPETKHAVLRNIYDVLKEVSYTPFEIETQGNPVYDLGDYIKSVDVSKDNKTYISPITYYYWSYRGKNKLRAVGGNPKLNGVNNKQGKQLQSLEAEINSKSIIVKEFRNSDEIIFSSEEAMISSINYAVTEPSKSIFLLSIRLETNLDGVLVIQFYTDAKLDEDRTFKAYIERGKHVVSLFECYTDDTDARHTITVKAHMEYFESDSRLQTAKTQTCDNFLQAIKDTGATVSDNVVVFPSYSISEIDKTIARATIKEGEVLSILYGQGIAGEGKWDGTINFAENIIGDIEFNGGLSFNNNIIESINNKLQAPIGGVFSQQLGSVAFRGSFGFKNNISEKLRFGWSGDSYTWQDVLDEWTWNDIKSNDWQFLKGDDINGNSDN